MGGKQGYRGPVSIIILGGMSKRIDDMCYEKNISYKQLARMAGISKSTLMHILEYNNCTTNTAISIARALGCSLDYLILGKKSNISKKETVEDFTYDLLDDFDRMKEQKND